MNYSDLEKIVLLEEARVACVERARIVRLLKEVMTVKRGPFPAQRKVKAVERLIEELTCS